MEKVGESWRRLEKVRRLKKFGEVCSMVGEGWCMLKKVRKRLEKDEEGWRRLEKVGEV